MAGRSARYSSPTIVARRESLLKDALSMIAESGIESLSIGDLSKRAGVAKQTIYNIFETRERLIATAISSYFEKNDRTIVYQTPPATMERMIERSIVASTRAQQVPNYIRALMAVYLAADTDPQIWSAIHKVGTYAHEAWILSLAGKGQLQPWCDPASLIDDIARFRYGIIHEWCSGRIDRDDLLMREVVGSLAMVLGNTRGAAHTEIAEALNRIGQEGLPSFPIAASLDIVTHAGVGDAVEGGD